MNKTLFIKLNDASIKQDLLFSALEDANNGNRHEIDPENFKAIPGATFAYWVSETVINLFVKMPNMTGWGAETKCGPGTLDNFRFLRLKWEIDTYLTKWQPFAKGGAYSPWYSDIYLALKWWMDGEEVKSFVESKVGSASRKIQAQGYYFRPGLTWPHRTQKGLGLRVLPKGCIFGDKGPAAFVEDDDPGYLFSLLAITNSPAFKGLVSLQMAFGSFEVGVLQRTPVPRLNSHDRELLAASAKSLWAIRQKQDQTEETSHVFLLPALFLGNGETLAVRAAFWDQKLQAAEAEIQRFQAEIDEKCWDLYGIAEADRQALTNPGMAGAENEESGEDSGESDEEGEGSTAVTPEALAEDLASWLFGAVLGRWDAALATGERPIPPLPGPFDKLPPVSRGMLLGADGLHPAKDAAGRFLPEHDLLLDDEGESLDLVRRVRHLLEHVAGERADAWLLELEGLLGADLRTWYRRSFFERHLKRYSKSRRKAPIYWQLGTPSGSYSVWLYYPRLTRDSLFRLLNDVVKPKVAYEEQHLAGLREQNARRSELEPQEALVEELQAFRDEVARVTPLFDPNLDDGVLINAAPLHRLFVHAGWRRDTQAAWTQLVRGDFEWSHMALHLWPERVIPLCAEQRHLALAHDLDGPLKTRSVEDLVASHTRPAVKDALQALLNASPQAGGRSAGRPARAPRAPRPAPEPRSAAEPTPRAPRASAEVPEATLAAIREVLARFPGGASKSDVLGVTGLGDGEWNTAIKSLVDSNQVERQGEKRGTRYLLITRN